MDQSENVTVENYSTTVQPSIAGQNDNNNENSQNQVQIEQELHSNEANVERFDGAKESISAEDNIEHIHIESQMGIQKEVEKDQNNVLDSEPEKCLDTNETDMDHEELDGAINIVTDKENNLDSISSHNRKCINDDHELLLKPIDESDPNKNTEDNNKNLNLEKLSQPLVSDKNKEIVSNHNNETHEKYLLNPCDEYDNILTGSVKDQDKPDLVEILSDNPTKDLNKETKLSEDNSEKLQPIESDLNDLNAS